MSPYKALEEILRKAQGHTSKETNKPIDIGYEVTVLRQEIDRCRYYLLGPGALERQ